MPGPTLDDIKHLKFDWTTLAIKDFADVFGRLSSVSGLYSSRSVALTPSKVGRTLTRSIVRFDVDGTFPLDVASGTYYGDPFANVYNSTLEPVHWVAYPMVKKGSGLWEGEIVTRWPSYAPLLPHKSVRIHVDIGPVSYLGARMTVTFFGNAAELTDQLRFESPYFRTTEFEYDVVEGASQSTQYKTHLHPNRPPTLPDEQLTITKVYDRAGIEVLQSPNRNVVPLDLSGEDSQWTNQELHDAMRTYWSRYKPRAQWAAWMLFAGRHDERLLGGIMFDYANGPYQRQGAAVFCDTLADAVAPDEAHPAQWFARERFFAAVHELGHAFNLNHSFQKQDQTPWRTLENVEAARSFMNYPRRVEERLGQNFWNSFFYRFDDKELYFMRHAPDDFVEMGANEAGTEHGFAAGAASAYVGLSFDVAVARTTRVFDFLEPVTIDVSVTNTGRYPRLVDPALLSDGHALQLTIGAGTAPARRWRPYAEGCTFGLLRVLNPGESLTASLFVSAGRGGWHIAEPGAYSLSASLSVAGQQIAAPPLSLRVASPRSLDAECLAQDFFSDEVGRAIAFGGTHSMNGANDTLRAVTERFADRPLARHALVTLALPQMRNRKALHLPAGEAPMSAVSADHGCLQVVRANPDAARQALETALLRDPAAAVGTLGYAGYRRTVQQFADWLEATGDANLAEAARAAGRTAPRAAPGICGGGDASPPHGAKS